MTKIGVLGAGSWGTAIAQHLSQKNSVVLWSFSDIQAREIIETRHNEKYLKGISLSPNIEITSSLPSFIEQVDIIVLVTPSTALKKLLIEIKELIRVGQVPILNATKGLDHETNCFFYDYIDELFNYPVQAVLSGPNFASEVARQLPTATTISSKNERDVKFFLPFFHHSNMRVYSNLDPIGVQLAGTYKNVIAIAAGISEGLGLGNNARAALITRGLAEMTKLGVSLGATLETFLGLAGLGDLTLTATSTESRNYRFGKYLGMGEDAKSIFKKIGQIVEGYNNAQNMYQLGKKQNIELPIANEIYQIVNHGKSPNQALEDLLGREAKFETGELVY